MNQNTIAVIGFCFMSFIAVVMSFNSNFITPVDKLVHVARENAIATKVDERVYVNNRQYAGADVEYKFIVHGKEYQGSSAIDGRISVGDNIVIQYHSGNPEINGVEMIGHSVIDLVFFVIPAIVLIICGFVLYFKFSKHRAENAQ